MGENEGFHPELKGSNQNVGQASAADYIAGLNGAAALNHPADRSESRFLDKGRQLIQFSF
jgi:hypothetical protein